ncbi:MAG: transporter [bacterium]
MTKVKNLVVYVFAITAVIGFSSLALAHEPLFGLGPHTVGQYSWALESELERGQEGWANHYEPIYGITPDLAVTAALPFVLSQEGGKSGLGDFVLRGKYRFIRLDFLKGSDAFALHWGMKFPTGNRRELRGSGTWDYFVGVSFGHESRKHYAFADFRYQINGSVEDLKRGNFLNLDAAYGIRPWQLEYLQPDLVLLVEMLGEVENKNSLNGIEDPNSGGSMISLAPGFLFSYRNFMVKGGVKFSLVQNLNGIQENPVPEFVFAVEFHMLPFK